MDETANHRVNVVPVDIPMTPRLLAEARSWQQHGRRPSEIVSPGPTQESVWDYPRPPTVQRVVDRVVVEFAGVVIADTDRAVRVCETSSPPTYYIPAADVAAGALLDAPGSSHCEWKGAARYHSIEAAGRFAKSCAWSYPAPTTEYEVLRDAIAFYPGRVDRCTVGGMVVRPQPGQFYGGWITPDLTGPFKGEPGSQGW